MKKIHRYFNLNTPDFGDFLEYRKENTLKETENKKEIGCGISTMIFDDGEKVIGLCIDYNKLLYLKRSKTANFRFLKFISFEHNGETHFLGMYEMDKLEKLKKPERTLLERLKELPNSDYVDRRIDDRVMDILKKSGAKIDFELIEKIDSNPHTDSCVYDFNHKQFLRNKSGEIVCFDPISSTNILKLFLKKFNRPIPFNEPNKK